MDKQQIKEAAAKASEDYVLKRLAEIPFNEVAEEIADYLQEKEDAL